MFKKFFSYLTFIFSSFNIIQKIKKDENKICYVTGFRRYISILIDLIIIILILQFCNIIINQILINSEDRKTLNKISATYNIKVQISSKEKSVQNKFIKVIIINQAIQFIIIFIYIVFMWIKFSATPGKLLLGLRIVNKNNFTKITFKQATKRFFFFILSIIPIFLGFIWSNFDKHCQTWHDKIANTVVITNKSLKKFKEKI